MGLSKHRKIQIRPIHTFPDRHQFDKYNTLSIDLFTRQVVEMVSLYNGVVWQKLRLPEYGVSKGVTVTSIFYRNVELRLCLTSCRHRARWRSHDSRKKHKSR